MTEMRSVLDPRYDAAYEDRIRELEAELAASLEGASLGGKLMRQEVIELQARAEKAEVRVGEYYEIVVKLNARVAELERKLETWDSEKRSFGWWREPAPAIERHEREAD